MTILTKGILLYGGLMALLLSSIILLSLWANPRLWIQDLPKELQQKIPPKTEKEKKQTTYVMLFFLFVLLTLPVFGIADIFDVIDVQPTFLQSFMLSYGMYFVFNLVDLLLIDWLVICFITPDFIRVPGIEAEALKNYSKHLGDFAKGIFIIIIPAAVSGSIGYCLL